MAGHVMFDGVWKRFRRGMGHDSLRDLIPALVRRARSTPADRAARELGEGDFWAVRDVSFEVKPGEALGIIGGNGAGKSTILKLLTNIYVPTRGRAAITGRTGALIEVSAGFHQDLTGRENIFLQGAIMGMPMSLIHQRFDDIVEFSGISAFIDTPVKRYSSGMNARLGFSIAVHLEPDVLIIDEVLAVGDAEFQGRAFDRIRALVRADIPVVIVSHQLDRVVELCTSCILLNRGTVAFQGDPRGAVAAYLGGHAGDVSARDSVASGIGITEIHDSEPDKVVSGGPIRWTMTGEVTTPVPPPNVSVEIRIVDAATSQLVHSVSLEQLGVHPTTTGVFRFHYDVVASLPAGLYRIETFSWQPEKDLIVGSGANRIFQVLPGRVFTGTHQLSAVASPLP